MLMSLGAEVHEGNERRLLAYDKNMVFISDYWLYNGKIDLNFEVEEGKERSSGATQNKVLDWKSIEKFQHLL